MGNTKPIRVCEEFLEDIWEKARLQEGKRLGIKEEEIKNIIKDPQVSRALRQRLIAAGGLKE